MLIEHLLSQKGNGVATLSLSATVADAVLMLNRENFGVVVVLGEDGAVAGVVSERDIVRHLPENAETVMTRPVASVMTQNPITCTRDGRIDDILLLMLGWNIRHLPVVENGALLGLVSMGDLVKSMIDPAESPRKVAHKRTLP